MVNKLDLNKLSFEELQNKVKELEQQKKKATVKEVGVWQIGENYFIRTVTMNLMGKLVEVAEKELVLESASWIADTGRFSNFLKEGHVGTNGEIEPFPEGRVIVGRGALIDATIWKHNLLIKQK